MQNEIYDVIIVGGGPIGLSCAIEAKKSGLNFLILEKGVLVNSIFHYPVNMTFFSSSDRLEIGNVPFVSINDKPGRNEALEYYRRITTTFQLKIHLFERVNDIEKEKDDFLISTSKRKYQTHNVIIATGFYDIPYPLKVKGEDLKKVKHFYDDPHFYAFQKVIVVGASNSAVDAALETWRKGAKVSLVIRGDKLSDHVKYWVKPDMENRIKEGSIQAFFNSNITEIRAHEVDVETPQGKITLENDWVLAMTGYQPDLPFLKKIGVEVASNDACSPTYSTDTYETNVPGIYLAGVVCGGLNTHKLFIENSREHGEKIIHHIVEKRKKETK